MRKRYAVFCVIERGAESYQQALSDVRSEICEDEGLLDAVEVGEHGVDLTERVKAILAEATPRPAGEHLKVVSVHFERKPLRPVFTLEDGRQVTVEWNPTGTGWTTDFAFKSAAEEVKP